MQALLQGKGSGRAGHVLAHMLGGGGREADYWGVMNVLDAADIILWTAVEQGGRVGGGPCVWCGHYAMQLAGGLQCMQAGNQALCRRRPMTALPARSASMLTPQTPLPPLRHKSRLSGNRLERQYRSVKEWFILWLDNLVTLLGRGMQWHFVRARISELSRRTYPESGQLAATGAYAQVAAG